MRRFETTWRLILWQDMHFVNVYHDIRANYERVPLLAGGRYVGSVVFHLWSW